LRQENAAAAAAAGDDKFEDISPVVIPTLKRRREPVPASALPVGYTVPQRALNFAALAGPSFTYRLPVSEEINLSTFNVPLFKLPKKHNQAIIGNPVTAGKWADEAYTSIQQLSKGIKETRKIAHNYFNFAHNCESELKVVKQEQEVLTTQYKQVVAAHDTLGGLLSNRDQAIKKNWEDYATLRENYLDILEARDKWTQERSDLQQERDNLAAQLVQARNETRDAQAERDTAQEELDLANSVLFRLQGEVQKWADHSGH
jgi:hypothetical protein